MTKTKVHKLKKRKKYPVLKTTLDISRHISIIDHKIIHKGEKLYLYLYFEQKVKYLKDM